MKKTANQFVYYVKKQLMIFVYLWNGRKWNIDFKKRHNFQHQTFRW